MSRGRILLISAPDNRLEAMVGALTRKGFQIEVGGEDALEEGPLDALLLDLERPDGLQLCERVTTDHADLPVIVLTRRGTLEVAIHSMRAGAYDYLFHPLRVEAVAIAIDRAVQHRKMRRELRKLRRVVVGPRGFEELIGSSPSMQELYELLEQVAESEASVLVCGETGVGKELAAQAIHRRSERKEGPFIALNCAAVPEALLESELFGHVRGAFTDARSSRTGLFAQASGGTLFLDEIGELPVALQPKLLRALQQRAARPVGSDREVAFDVRVIAATNLDLEAAIEARTFRRDLYFRLNVIQVDVPPLRGRGNDILVLARHFLRQAATRTRKPVEGLSVETTRRLLEYPWPGNVRELENCMERAVALCRASEIALSMLPTRIRDYRSSHVLLTASVPEELVPMSVIEERYIRRVLAAVGGRRGEAARILGFDRKTLYRKLIRYGISKEKPGNGK